MVIYCSSAGEYEQARPLVDRLGENVYVHVIFFSRSGYDYVAARGETIAMSLAPIGDSAWEWGWLFAALRPSLTVVVRHELWPGFLAAAKSYGPLYLIAASRSQGAEASGPRRMVRTQLLRAFDRIYAVSEDDVNFFHQHYGIARDRLAAVGDPKYDRVLERAAQTGATTQRLQQAFDMISPQLKRRLVLGSAHLPDVRVVLEAFRQAPAARSWQLVLAPHHLNADALDQIEATCHAAEITTLRYSRTEAMKSMDVSVNPVVILDTMGMLAEAYGTADAAFIGGAMHHQIHNVLEPACRGLALACGPFYKNSQEAVRLVQSGLMTVVQDGRDLAAWWQTLESELERRSSAVRAAVLEMAGASDRILTDWGRHLDLEQ